ncbi:MAG TPA: hypothetical protein VFL90_01985 [Methylomirabilota bacterium]|nr:hypothetical protein [Methylomirabilota bacterium]
MSRIARTLAALLLGAAVASPLALAQGPSMPHPMPPGAMPHGAMGHGAMAAETSQPGQAAFAALAEVVRVLDADPDTDWSRVDLERVRQHLIDMDEVLLRATVTQAPVPGGLAMDVTGSGRTEQAIRAMLPAHAHELDALPAYAAKAEPIAGGVRLTVTAKNAGDAKAVARLRGLGFAGLLTEGGHHGPHHLALARGQAPGHMH